MMKNVFFTVALTVTACAQMNAQNIRHNSPFAPIRPHDAVTQGILQRQQSAAANRGTGVTDRLVSWKLESDFGVDSVHFKYNGTSRGSSLDNNLLTTYMEGGYTPYYNQQQPYPIMVSRNAPASKYDSAYSQFKEGDTIRGASSYARAYTGNSLSTEFQKSDDFYDGVHYKNSMRVDFTYGTSGNLMSSLVKYDTSANFNGNFVLQSAYYNNYNGSNLAKDSSVNYPSGVAETSEIVTYTYDGAGNMISAIRQIDNGGGLRPNNRHVYTYASNKLATHLAQYSNDGVTWENDVIDSFRYTGNNLNYQSSYSWDDMSASWWEGYLTKVYYNAQNNRDSEVYLRIANGIIENDSKAMYTYNAYGHYNNVLVYYYDNGSYSTTPDAGLYLTYETYNTTGIKATAPVLNGVVLFPNPAKEAVNIRFKEMPKSAVSLRIYNALGQLMLQSATNASSAVQVAVSALAPGNYTVEISADGASQHLSFVKY